MGLESMTGTSVFINTLNKDWPLAGDQKSLGDDHLRGVKNILLNSFPAITGAVTATHTELNLLNGVNALKGITSVTTTHAGAVADENKLILANATSGAFDVDLVAAATAGAGFRMAVKKTDSSANVVTLDPNASETIDGAASFTLEAQYESVVIESDGTNWQVIAYYAPVVSQAVAEAGTVTRGTLPPIRVAQAIAALASGADSLARTQTLLNKLEILLLSSTALGMADGAADAFESDTIGGTSTDETYDASGDYYHNLGSESPVAGGTGSVIGNATANGGLAAAFDGTTAQNQAASAFYSGAALTVGKDWGAGTEKNISKVVVYGSSDNGMKQGVPTDFDAYLEGSDNNSDWTTLGSSLTIADSAGVTFTVTATANMREYRYHRLRTTASGTDNWACAEATFHEKPISDVTLVSAAATASAAPTDAQIVVLYKDDAGTSVVGTDFTVEISRDGGTTYTAVTMTDEGAWVAPDSASYRILSGLVDISAQPSGTSMKYRIKMLNGLPQRTRAVAYMWG